MTSKTNRALAAQSMKADKRIAAIGAAIAKQKGTTDEMLLLQQLIAYRTLTGYAELNEDPRRSEIIEHRDRNFSGIGDLLIHAEEDINNLSRELYENSAFDRDQADALAEKLVSRGWTKRR